jgi:hypothetical protein
VLAAAERLTRYRRYVYEARAVDRSEKQLAPVPSSGATPVPSAGATGQAVQAAVIDNSVLEKERKTPVKYPSLLSKINLTGQGDFEIKRIQRFRYRTRCFTDSGIIGTKKFVAANYRRFKDLFMSKKEKVPKLVAGLDRIYSLKRLAES